MFKRNLAALIGILASFQVTAVPAYQLQAQSQTGATAGSTGVLYQNLIYAPGKSSWSGADGYFLDVFDATAPASTGPLRRLKLDSAAREVSLSGDLLLIKYPDHVELMRLSGQEEQSLGTVILPQAVAYAYQAAIHNNQLALRKKLSAGQTDIEIYQVGERISLKKTLQYNSAGSARPLTLDGSYVYVVDKDSAPCNTCTAQMLHRINIDNNEVKSVTTAHKTGNPQYAGNGYFYALDPDSPFSVNIFKFDNDKLTLLYALPVSIQNILRGSDGRLLYADVNQQQLCQISLAVSGPGAAVCQEVPQYKLRQTSFFGEQRNGYATANQLVLLNQDLPPTSRPWLREPALLQFGWLNGQLLLLSDKGYLWQDPTSNSLIEAKGIAAASTASESRLPLFFTESQLLSYRRVQGSQLFWNIHSLQQGELTQTSSQQLMMSEFYNAAGAVHGQYYFANFVEQLEVFKHDSGNSSVVAKIPASKLQTADGIALTPFESYQQKEIHLENILFKPTAAHLLYVPISATGDKVLQRIPDVQRFASYGDKLLVAYENQLRQYQWQTPQYVQIGAVTTAGCAPEAKPVSISISDNKAIVVMHLQSASVPLHRNFLCIYDISDTAMKFETQLELPTAARGDSMFKMKGKDLYGIVGNDGRLLHYQQNFAPTFPSHISVAEDSHTAALVVISDAENDALTLQMTKAAAQGNADIAGNQISYTPKSNYHGTDVIGVKVTDIAGNVTEQEVKITITPVNDAPDIDALQFNVSQNTKYTGQLKASDPDGDTLSFAVLTQPKLGTLTLNSDGSFSYLPTQSGDDTFEVKVSDGNGGEDKTLVSIKVNASTPTGGSTSQPAQTGSSSGGSSGVICILLLGVLAGRRRLSA